MGHKYTFVKVGHIGAQIYIHKSGAHWGNGSHGGTNIHSQKWGTLAHKYTFGKVEIYWENEAC